jgi:16S rRNA (cytidine1402-2'-O)-methyltransferase
MAAEAGSVAPGLYLVSTPIGNLRDVSIRALATLAGAAAILAEDTRVTSRLLAHYGITTPLCPTTSIRGRAPGSVRSRGSRRGTHSPWCRTPERLWCPIRVTGSSRPPLRRRSRSSPSRGRPRPWPGWSCRVFPTDRFFFEGFLPAKSGARRARMAELAAIPATLVLYEAPHRLAASLVDAADVLGPRPAAVARELTKFYETVRRGTLVELAESYGAEAAPKGEIVLLIGQASQEARAAERKSGLDERLLESLVHHSIKDAAALVAAETGLAKRDVYARALALAKEARGKAADA